MATPWSPCVVRSCCVYHRSHRRLARRDHTDHTWLPLCVHWSNSRSHSTLAATKKVFSSAGCSWNKPSFSFVRGQDSTMWDIVINETLQQCRISLCIYTNCVRLFPDLSLAFVNPLEFRSNYSATSNNIKLVHWADGTVRTQLGGAAALPGPSSLYQM